MSPDERLAAIEKRFREIPGEIALTQGRIEESRKRVESTEARVAEAREERQRLLAAGKKADKPSAEMRAIREDSEELQDLVLGLERRLGDLRAEEIALREEEKKCSYEAARLAVIPLMNRYNAVAKELGGISKEIYLTSVKYREDLSEFRVNGLVSPSSWEGWATVSSLSLPGEPNGHFFDQKALVYALRERHEKAIVERQKSGGDPQENLFVKVATLMMREEDKEGG